MMNDSNEINHQTKLYGFIGEFAGQSSISATLNKLLKTNNKDAMMIPMNIREDDFYFTVSNMKKSHVNGSLIANEFVTSVVEILDESSDIVKKSGMCDILVRDGEKLVGDVILIDILINFLNNNNLKKIALLGTNHYAKAFVYKAKDFKLSFYDENLEQVMEFVSTMDVEEDADINRIAQNMQVDLSSYDSVIDFSDLETLAMVSSLAQVNIDMKQKKTFSSLKQRSLELDNKYLGFEEMLDEVSSGVFEFFKNKKHLEYDKSDMRF